MCIYIADSPCCTVETNNIAKQLYSNIFLKDVHIYSGILCNNKKEWNNAICSNTHGYRDEVK